MWMSRVRCSSLTEKAWYDTEARRRMPLHRLPVIIKIQQADDECGLREQPVLNREDRDDRHAVAVRDGDEVCGALVAYRHRHAEVVGLCGVGSPFPRDELAGEDDSEGHVEDGDEELPDVGDDEVFKEATDALDGTSTLVWCLKGVWERGLGCLPPRAGSTR